MCWPCRVLARERGEQICGVCVRARGARAMFTNKFTLIIANQLTPALKTALATNCQKLEIPLVVSFDFGTTVAAIIFDFNISTTSPSYLTI